MQDIGAIQGTGLLTLSSYVFSTFAVMGQLVFWFIILQKLPPVTKPNRSISTITIFTKSWLFFVLVASTLFANLVMRDLLLGASLV